MFWRKRRGEKISQSRHRGRIWFDGDWWRYACTDCDYGAGSVSDGWASRITHPWLIKTATEHCDPSDWSRNRGVKR